MKCPGAVLTPTLKRPGTSSGSGKAVSPEVPQKMAVSKTESSQVEDVGGDPLLVDGNRVRVTWPMEDGTRAEVGGAVRWLAERAAQGRKRVYEVAFDDGDVGKVAFTVTGSEYKAGRWWTKREEEAEDAGGDPLLVDGNRVRVTWPMEDGTRAEVGGAVRWLVERAAQGRKRVYEVAFDDGDVRRTQLVGKAGNTAGGVGKHWDVTGQKCKSSQ
ncbi:hypothetical protein CYMTET_23529 [Cymbomonas tetramitiformis]|uniref:Uncharacterized protein n=1 Tax=Cymbomonas tetramitiformis TaxID=36881 RepID=A0AAE0FYB7_9CHLO|nr:hypothetical protein CYMTET_23529 [Cymbomonas tetramitiformis]